MLSEYIATLAIFVSFFIICYLLSRVDVLPHVTKSSIGKRYYYLDGIRGLAAICVINAHIWRITSNGMTFNGFNTNSSYAGLMGSFGVQIFFCITGFLFFDQMKKKNYEIDWQRFFIARIKRLVPLYVFSITISVIMMLIIGGISRIGISDIYNIFKLYHFGFSGNGGGGTIAGYNPAMLTASIWTLPYEWRFYLLMPIMTIMMKSNRAILPAIALLSLVITFGHDGAGVWVYFVIGAVSSSLVNVRLNQGIRIISFIAFLILSCLYFYLDHSLYGVVSYLLIGGVFTALLISKPRFMSSKVFIYMGEISYSVYLNHLIVIVILSFVFGKLLEFKNVEVSVAILIYLLVSASVCICSVLTFKYIEHPFMKKQAR